MARQVQREIAQLIARGCVVMTQKTKLAHEGGRQLVSVGPYRTAVGPKRFAVITGRGSFERLSAITAAKDFVDFVGRARAGEAAARAAYKCR
jgi:hypothetical protein